MRCRNAFDARAGIGADQHLTALRLGQLRQRRVQGGDVGGAVRRRGSRGAGRPPGSPRCRARRGRRTRTSARTRSHACRSARHPPSPNGPGTSVTSRSTMTWPPSRLPGRPSSGRRRPQARDRACGPSGSDRRQRDVDVAGQGGDQSRHRRIGGDQTEQARLGPDHGQISQTVPAQGDREREIERGSCPDHARPAPAATATRPPTQPGHTRRPGPPHPAAPRPEDGPTTRGPGREPPDSEPSYASPTECLSARSPCRLRKSQESQAGQALPCVTRRPHPNQTKSRG